MEITNTNFFESTAKHNIPQPMAQLKFEAETKKLFWIYLQCIFLSIITLGIYSFWGKTKMRKYLARSFILNGDRLEYFGTGLELFTSFLKAIVLYLLFVAFCSIHPGLPALFLLLVPYLIYVGAYSTLKYRLSRTSWRGFRGKMTGSAFYFGAACIYDNFLNAVSIGILIPHTDILRHKYKIENTYFGNKKFEFTEPKESLFVVNLVTLVLFFPTLGLSRFWYYAALRNLLNNNTKLNGVEFKSTYTGGDLLCMFLINIIVTFCTLGLGIPYLIKINFQYIAENNYIIGDIDTANIQQAEEINAGQGEGLEQVFGFEHGVIT